MAQLTPLPDYEGEQSEEEAPSEGWLQQMAAALNRFAGDLQGTASQLSAAAGAFAGEAARLVREAGTEPGATAPDSAAASETLAEVQAVQASVVSASEEVRSEIAEAIEDVRAMRESLDELAHDFRAQMTTAAGEAVGRIAAEGGRWSDLLQAAADSAKVEVIAAGQSLSPRELLERLEADYRLLRGIVGTLNERIGSIDHVASAPSTQLAAAGAPMHLDQPPPSVALRDAMSNEADEWHEIEAADAPLEASSPSTHEDSPPDWEPPPTHTTPKDLLDVFVQTAAAPYAEATSIPESDAPESHSEPTVPTTPSTSQADVARLGADDDSETGAAPGAEAGAWIKGDVRVEVEPVPDFDRLLTLDGALNRLPAVRNVTLADYTREKVTFQMEVTKPAEASAFATGLSDLIGQTLDIQVAGPDRVHLRFSTA